MKTHIWYGTCVETNISAKLQQIRKQVLRARRPWNRDSYSIIVFLRYCWAIDWISLCCIKLMVEFLLWGLFSLMAQGGTMVLLKPSSVWVFLGLVEILVHSTIVLLNYVWAIGLFAGVCLLNGTKRGSSHNNSFVTTTFIVPLNFNLPQHGSIFKQSFDQALSVFESRVWSHVFAAS